MRGADLDTNATSDGGGGSDGGGDELFWLFDGALAWSDAKY